MLPPRTTFLIVGAGPTGLACAISLAKQGCTDIVIVDAVVQGENTSRALAIHAATLEDLDTVGCADDLVKLGLKGQGLGVRVGPKTLISAQFSYIAEYTRFPFVLILPQNITERVLGEHLRALDAVQIFRPYKVTNLRTNESDENIIDAVFETGEVMQARYVIGADGARSIVRQLSGIGFGDPDGETPHPTFAQLILADITFSAPPNPPLQPEELSGFASDKGFIIILPMPASFLTGTSATLERPADNPVFRFGCNIPVGDGVPPHAPPTSYIQAALNKSGPPHLSSDPAVNPHPIHITETYWSTRFRTHAAIADRLFVRFKGHESSPDSKTGGIVFLIGDAAHIHSPAGGQGMNLGIRDAIGLGSVLAQHLKLSESDGDADKVVRDYAAVRHGRALTIIHFVKRIQKVGLSLQSNILRNIFYYTLATLGTFPAVRKALAWRLSGLGMR